ncbi:hypothetical protein Sango_2677700 [Sesamum angolense]|uniref:Uncharacterized protein n=1 Tax=Sesamum angolense TaxID=2727404 RepID=A0AAE1W2I8_9LAMI|nr:hypothetical protein Sango_2677700 [Sesamum angolense]
MVFDAVGPICPPVHVSHQSNENETGMSSNDQGGSFFDVVNAADQPLYSGSENHSQLSAVARLVNIKSEYNLSQSCYDEISQLIGELLPRDHTLPKDYSTKKLIRELGLSVEKIDACKAGCMLFWKDDKHLEFCKFCWHAIYKPVKVQKSRRKRSAYATLRYLPITPRLQRLYASNTTAEHMSWHATHETENGVMCHPFDVEAWKHFDDTHPYFATEPRNVRLGLCADGFAPHGQYSKSYSCWPVITHIQPSRDVYET